MSLVGLFTRDFSLRSPYTNVAVLARDRLRIYENKDYAIRNGDSLECHAEVVPNIA